MEYIVVGLGNPGEEYEQTRHNVGRMVAELLHERVGASDWRDDKKLRAKVSQGSVEKNKNIKLVLPDNYMNRSGGSVAPLVKNKKQAERLIVVQDDIDLGVGTLKIVFNRGSGGHRGVDSIIRSLKTKAFIRVRVGVLPLTPTGKLKKPKGEDKVYNFILRKLPKKDLELIKKSVKYATDAVEEIIKNGHVKAMCEYNTSTSVKKKKTSKKKKTKK